MKQDLFDVIVIGAGAAGLMAAWELALTGKKVAVLEAKDRIGGRVHTIQDPAFELPVELGAEFIHGKLEPTLLLLKKAGAQPYEVTGDIWQKDDGTLDEQKDFIEDYSALNKKFKDLDGDISVADFINDHLRNKKFETLRFSLKNYVEGYYAADTNKASTFALKEDLNKSDDEQYRIEGGYRTLFDYITGQCTEHGVAFFLKHPVTGIHWQKDNVEIYTPHKTLRAKKVLVTVAIGVLQAEKIHFSPAIPHKIEAAKKLGYGPVVKTILQFDEAFWKDREYTQHKNLRKLSFIFSEATIPTWWTYHPKDVAMITGWSGGPHAEELAGFNDEMILEIALQSLADIFTVTMQELRKKLRGRHVANWSNDPYSCGAYSYEVVNGNEAKKIIKEPEQNTLFFTGEGLFEGPEIGTVNAALSLGRDTAHQIIATFDHR